jgi:hypothetical protein
MAETPDDDAVERVINNYVDPSSTGEKELEADLDAEGFSQAAIQAFTDRTVSLEEAVEEVERVREGSVGVTTREQVEETVESMDSGAPGSFERAVAEDAAKDLGAPSEASVSNARRQAAQFVDEEGNVRSNPDLDPAAQGGEGRVIMDAEDFSVGQGTGSYEGGDLQEGVTRDGTFYLERRSTGERFPVSEVDL